MKTIAVIGTGIMGRGIVLNFLKNKYKVVVWNRSKAKLKEFTQKGAQIAKTPKEATQKADTIFEVTANDKSSKSVWLGKNGILAGADPKKVLTANGTFSVEWIDELAKACTKKGFKFLDMPLTGGRRGAENGQLVLLVGGSQNVLKSIEKDLKAIAEEVVYFGKAGSGMRYKLILNTLQAIHMQAFGEMLKIAKSAGLDIQKVGEALAKRPGGTTTQFTWRDMPKEPNPINFALEWMLKDLTYAKQLAKKVKTPLLDNVQRKLKYAVAKGMGKRDMTTINKI